MATEQSKNQSPTSERPKLPSKFAGELWKAYAKQQKRKVRTGTLPSASVDVNLDDYVSFGEHLKSSNRILALFGAGLSAASGVPTFRGAGGFWREYDCMTLATPGAFAKDPALVWQFYNYRRHVVLKAKPNRAHVALAELAKRKPNYLAISQNIDGLCQRANHPPENIQPVHGSLFDLKCTNDGCDYVDKDNRSDPIVPALALPDDVDVSDAKIPIRDVAVEDLPHCPKCKSLLRPDVVWFGEALPQMALDRIREFMSADSGKIDLMLVVGTTALVYPAAGYIHAARAQGARVAVFNMEESEEEGAASNLKEGDWFFHGDASVIVPEVLKEVIGVVPNL